MDLRRRHVPCLQMRARAEGEEERRALAREMPHRRLIHMIVMIVGDQHRVDIVKRRKRQRRRMETLRPGELHRRCAVGKHRIGQQAQPRHLDQDAGMAEPCRPQRLGRGHAQILLRQHHDGQRRWRHALLLAKKLLLQIVPCQLVRGLPLRIDEAAVMIMRRRLDARQPLPRDMGAQSVTDNNDAKDQNQHPGTHADTHLLPEPHPRLP